MSRTNSIDFADGGGLRRRRTGRRIVESFIKNCDVFPKFEEETEKSDRLTSFQGGVLSVFTMSVIGILVLGELKTLYFGQTHETIMVDPTFKSKLNIAFDITFPSLSCYHTHLNLMDIAGDTRAKEDVLWKTPLREDGKVMGNRYLDTARNRILASRQKIKTSGGCRVTGDFSINKVAGNFHFAMGDSQEMKDGVLVHRFNVDAISKFNCSHVINMVRFGTHFPGQKNLLNGQSEFIVEKGWSAAFSYELQIVPVSYTTVFGSLFYSNHYSFTMVKQPLRSRRPGDFDWKPGLPGVFFMFSFSPYMIKLDVLRPRFLKFIMRIAAIVGGVYTVSTLADRVGFYAFWRIKR